MKTAKIVIATGIYPPDIGGPATYSKLLNDELPQQGIDVEIVSFGSVRSLPKFIRHTVYFFKVLNAAWNADLVYAQDPVSTGLPAYFAARFMGKKFFLKIVGDYAWEQGTQRFGIHESLDTFSEQNNQAASAYPFFVRALKRVETSVASRADKIIVPSQYLKRIVSNWGIDSEKINIVYNSFDIPPVDLQAERRPPVSLKKHRTIMSIGRLVAWKGFELLIDIMPELLESYPDLILVIVGDGPDRKKLQEKISRLRLSDQVKLIGRLAHAKLLSELALADIFVLNTFYEGFSHQILEALALGIPVITTTAGGNPELITDGKNGLLVTYNARAELLKAIRVVLDNPGLTRLLQTAGKDKVNEFSTDRMIRELITLLP